MNEDDLKTVRIELLDLPETSKSYLKDRINDLEPKVRKK
jgi:hypothetical protein